MTEKGKLYGVGAGPGDPELLTCKAVRLLRECDVVAAPDGERTAYQIAAQYAEGKPALFCNLPMTRDKAAAAASHQAAADALCTLLDEGKTVKDAAEATGYLDSKAMIRAFKRYEGITPGQYKRKENKLGTPEDGGRKF